MTLIEAYRAIGPIIGQCDVDAVRSEAAGVLYDAARHAARRLKFPAEIREEAVSQLMLRVMRRAVGGRKWNDPTDDAGVEAWLHTCLRNQCISIVRSAGPPQDPADLERLEHGRAGAAPTGGGGDEPVDEDRMMAEAKAVWRQLEQEVLPSAAAGMRGGAGKDLERAFHEMRALVLRQTSIAGVVASQGRPAGPASEAAVYKQHQRARERLLAQVDQWLVAGRVEPLRATYLKNAVRSLRRRA